MYKVFWDGEYSHYMCGYGGQGGGSTGFSVTEELNPLVKVCFIQGWGRGGLTVLDDALLQ